MNKNRLKKIIKERQERPLPHGFMQRDLRKLFNVPKMDEEELENKLDYLNDYSKTWTERSKVRDLGLSEEDNMERKAIVAKVMEKLSGRKMDQPPKRWFNMMVKKVKKGNPEYSEQQAKATVGDIWYNQLSSAKRTELKKEYGKK